MQNRFHLFLLFTSYHSPVTIYILDNLDTRSAFCFHDFPFPQLRASPFWIPHSRETPVCRTIKTISCTETSRSCGTNPRVSKALRFLPFTSYQSPFTSYILDNLDTSPAFCFHDFPLPQLRATPFGIPHSRETPVCRTIKTISRTETSRSCGTNPRVSKALRFLPFTSYQSPFTSYILDNLDTSPAFCFHDFPLPQLRATPFGIPHSRETPVCRTIKTISRTETSRSCGTNPRVSKALRFLPFTIHHSPFTIHHSPVTIYILDNLDTRSAFCFHDFPFPQLRASPFWIPHSRETPVCRTIKTMSRTKTPRHKEQPFLP